MKPVISKNLALIFDMDGVIVDSTAAHNEAWAVYLSRHNLSVADIENRMLGKRNDEIVRDFFSHLPLTEEEVAGHGARKEEIYREMMHPVLGERIVPGVTDFIRRHSDLRIGLATNAEPANVNFILGRTGIENCFSAIVNGHDVKRPKPFPDIYLKVSEQLDVVPEFCVVFEDSLTGVQAARAAGMRVVGLSTTTADLPGTDLLVGSFLDPRIDPWLEQLASSA